MSQRDALLAQYLDLLLDANRTMNLTRIIDRAAAETLHIGDAMTLLPFLPKDEFKLADVGSGGGTPGIPLAIVRPDSQVTCIEATKKKAAFLERVVAELNLKNVKILADRAEHVGLGPQRESFDVAVARALGTMVWIAEWLIPLVKPGGKVLAMKGPKANEELPAAAGVIKLLGGKAAIVHPVELSGTAGHVIVEIAKIAPTPRRYPRPPTDAKGTPLR